MSDYKGDENKIIAGIHGSKVVALFTDAERRRNKIIMNFDTVMDVTGKDVQLGDELIILSDTKHEFRRPPEFPKQIIVYLSSNKERMIEIGKELGLSEDAVEKFMYCCYEVEIKVEVNIDGSYKMLNVS